jgi:hypothetical protein
VKNKGSKRVRVVVGEIYLSHVEAAAVGNNKRANQRSGIGATFREQRRASIAILIDKKAPEELFTCLFTKVRGLIQGSFGYLELLIKCI